MNTFSRNPFSRMSRSDDGRPAGRLGELAQRPAILWGALALLALFVVFAGWLGYGALQAKSSLEQSRDFAQQAKDALLDGKTEDATRFAENAQFHAKQARAATHSLPWNIVAAVPIAGSPFKSTQQISDVVVGLAKDVLLPAAGMGNGFSPDKLIDGTRINLQLLRAEEPRLSELSAAAAKLDAEAQAISQPAFLSTIRDARSQLQDQTSKLAQLLGISAVAAKLAPSMLGADGPRSYLLAFQGNAEARGTGGLLGGFGVLRFDNGIPTTDTLNTNTELEGASAAVDFGPEFNKQYGYTNPYTDYRNSNLSSHFPYAAQIWKSMWEQQSKQRVDGVIAIDPVALSYLLGALGPVTLPDGEVITQDNVVELTGSTAYIRWPTWQAARKRYLLSIANEVVKKLSGSMQSPRAVLDALGRAASERRIAVWSSVPADQEILEQTALGFAIPTDPAPYAEVVINNLAGNKMDYYLEREIEYAADGCEGDVRNSTITVRLTNTATDEALPEYVAGVMGNETRPIDVPPGTMLTSVRLLATVGAKLVSVTSGGKSVPAIVHSERGHPTFEVQVAIPPGQSGDLIFRLSEPSVPGAPRVPIQPLIDSPTPRISVPTCG
ncbi:Protein of unknown function DUF4012 [Mycobacteriaceae bacterium]